MKQTLTTLLAALTISTATVPVQASALPAAVVATQAAPQLPQTLAPALPATALLGAELSDATLTATEGQIAWVPVLIAGWMGGWGVSICYVFCNP